MPFAIVMWTDLVQERETKEGDLAACRGAAGSGVG